QKEFPDSWEVYAEIREELGALTEDTGIPLENLLRPAVVREAVWAATETAEISSPVQLREWLRQHDARPWQIELISPLLVAAIRRHGTF
ncbi:MAG TPA: ribonuclease D, partial [Corynebacterium sp.]|nr:ribonuclease D [Corynebacterium sp.]